MFFNTTPSISVSDAAQKVAGPDVAFIDVRTPAEFASGHAKYALNIPLNALGADAVARLKKYAQVYVICQSGGRSSMATKTLIAAGIKAINVSGGTSAWKSHGLPME